MKRLYSVWECVNGHTFESHVGVPALARCSQCEDNERWNRIAVFLEDRWHETETVSLAGTN